MRAGDGVIILRGLRERAGGGFRNVDRRLFSDILGNRDRASVVGRALEDHYECQYEKFAKNDPEVASFGDADDGPFVRFFKWIIDNQEAVMMFVKSIVVLFLAADEEPAGSPGI